MDKTSDILLNTLRQVIPGVKYQTYDKAALKAFQPLTLCQVAEWYWRVKTWNASLCFPNTDLPAFDLTRSEACVRLASNPSAYTSVIQSILDLTPAPSTGNPAVVAFSGQADGVVTDGGPHDTVIGYGFIVRQVSSYPAADAPSVPRWTSFPPWTLDTWNYIPETPPIPEGSWFRSDTFGDVPSPPNMPPFFPSGDEKNLFTMMGLGWAAQPYMVDNGDNGGDDSPGHPRFIPNPDGSGYYWQFGIRGKYHQNKPYYPITVGCRIDPSQFFRIKNKDGDYGYYPLPGLCNLVNDSYSFYKRAGDSEIGQIGDDSVNLKIYGPSGTYIYLIPTEGWP